MTEAEKDWIKSEFKSIHDKLDYNKILAQRVRSLEQLKWKFAGVIVGVSSAFSAMSPTSMPVVS